MGTRAGFWIGHPTPTETFTGLTPITPIRLLGCVAYDGHPGRFSTLLGIKSQDAFRRAIRELARERDDWTPARDGFPFPWVGDLFLSDYNYIFSRDPVIYRKVEIWVSCYHSGLVRFKDAYEWDVAQSRHTSDEPPFELVDPFAQPGIENALPKDLPVGVRRSPAGKGKDSIMMVFFE